MASGQFGQDSREELNRRGGQDEGFAGAVIGLNEDRELIRILDQRCQASDRLRGQRRSGSLGVTGPKRSS